MASALNADHIYDGLWRFEREVRLRYPHLDKVMQSLRDEHGGVPAIHLIDLWPSIVDRRIFHSKVQTDAFERILERWQDSKNLGKEFAFLHSFDSEGSLSKTWQLPYSTEENAVKTAEGMKKWLQKRRGAQP
ncbi:hypothetical protein PRK78_007523 [Emydomyces testavorans]|uniref:Uncharacterized protein n=1 Tax=Emydomyces testavorans TaxID=2070801 RepID=A0AAF0ILR3_9EURO|nr:hypothetical protein PRK78_007523 [Emydomyces testavorans]